MEAQETESIEFKSARSRENDESSGTKRSVSLDGSIELFVDSHVLLKSPSAQSLDSLIDSLIGDISTAQDDDVEESRSDVTPKVMMSNRFASRLRASSKKDQLSMESTSPRPLQSASEDNDPQKTASHFLELAVFPPVLTEQGELIFKKADIVGLFEDIRTGYETRLRRSILLTATPFELDNFFTAVRSDEIVRSAVGLTLCFVVYGGLERAIREVIWALEKRRLGQNTPDWMENLLTKGMGKTKQLTAAGQRQGSTFYGTECVNNFLWLLEIFRTLVVAVFEGHAVPDRLVEATEYARSIHILVCDGPHRRTHSEFLEDLKETNRRQCETATALKSIRELLTQSRYVNSHREKSSENLSRVEARLSVGDLDSLLNQMHDSLLPLGENVPAGEVLYRDLLVAMLIPWPSRTVTERAKSFSKELFGTRKRSGTSASDDEGNASARPTTAIRKRKVQTALALLGSTVGLLILEDFASALGVEKETGRMIRAAFTRHLMVESGQTSSDEKKTEEADLQLATKGTAADTLRVNLRETSKQKKMRILKGAGLGIGIGALAALTAGLAAPAIAGGIAVAGAAMGLTGAAGAATFMGSTIGAATIAAAFGAGSSGLAGWKYARLAAGVKHFRFVRLRPRRIWLERLVKGHSPHEEETLPLLEYNLEWAKREALDAWERLIVGSGSDAASIDSLLTVGRIALGEDGRSAEGKRLLRLQGAMLMDDALNLKKAARQFGWARTDEGDLQFSLSSPSGGTLLFPPMNERILCVSGGGHPADTVNPWKSLAYTNAEVFAVEWDPELQAKLGQSLDDIAIQYSISAAKLGLAFTTLGMVTTAVAWPVWLVQYASQIDNTWATCRARSEKAGLVLANAILEAARAGDNRPITLIGYSLGCRTIATCLEVFQKEGARQLVKDVIFAGAALNGLSATWTRMGDVVRGKMYNCYSKEDWLLSFLYRYNEWELNVAGLKPVNRAGVVNRDVSHLVKSHDHYAVAMPGILAELRSLPVLFNNRVHKQKKIRTAD